MKIVLSMFLLCMGFVGIWYVFYSAPTKLIVNEKRFMPSGATIVVFDKNISLYDFAQKLERQGVVRSAKIFLSVIQKLSLEKKIRQGTYVFTDTHNVIQIVRIVSSGTYGYTPVKITIPEGFTLSAIAKIVPNKLVDITAGDFILASKDLEGYLFPDTYFLYPYAKSSDLIALMRDNFDRKIKSLSTDIASSGKSLSEIIIMASILEKEVQTEVDKGLVSGLFWNRIKIGMPIQADSTLTYITGKTSAQLTITDLRGVSEFNSYNRKGLPPAPISNPGLVSITSAIKPTPNDYLFFLSDSKGVTHFSKTYAEHLRLKQKYIP